DLDQDLTGMLSMLQRLMGEEIELFWAPGKELWPVKMDPSQINQVLANLCINARDAIGGVGKVTIETSNVTLDEADCTSLMDNAPGEYVLLAVSDDGQGIEKDVLPHIFEPFFTTKREGKGTGLGLSMVYGIVSQNGGFVDVCSEPGHGTTFRIYLPRHSGRAVPIRMRHDAASKGKGHETVLLVEDEPAILRLCSRLLEKMGYHVVTAGTPGEAIRLAEEHAGDIDLVLTDVVMPEMNGRDLAKRLLSLYPNIKRLFMSGYTADVIAHHQVLEEGVCFIQKPFSQRELDLKIREALGKKEFHEA
ncbi:MAG: ATP-binding protein, partial [Planctomycetota bacterium]